MPVEGGPFAVAAGPFERGRRQAAGRVQIPQNSPHTAVGRGAAFSLRG